MDRKTAVKISNLVSEIEDLEMLKDQLNIFLSDFEYIPTELKTKLYELIDSYTTLKVSELEKL